MDCTSRRFKLVIDTLTRQTLTHLLAHLGAQVVNQILFQKDQRPADLGSGQHAAAGQIERVRPLDLGESLSTLSDALKRAVVEVRTRRRIPLKSGSTPSCSGSSQVAVLVRGVRRA